MIRIVASTIVERPMLTRNGASPSTHELFQKHIRDLPCTIECFRNAIVSVSRESKWCKLALLRNRVPVELFSLIKPYLIMKGDQDFYPSVADNRVPHRKYLLIESKLYRMELANDSTLTRIRYYIEEVNDFKGGHRNWSLWKFRSCYQSRIEFLRCVLYLLRGFYSNADEYETEYMLRYWF
jgi:hypothetical protein